MAKFEEIKSAIISAVSNPDTLETSIKAVLETMEGDYAAFESLANDYEAAQTRIRDLQDTNHKLFLAQTGTPDDAGKEEPELPTGSGVIAEFIEKVNSIGKEE